MNRAVIICAFVVALAMALTVPAPARSLSDADKEALAELIVRYEDALIKRNYWALGAAVPPRVLKRYVDARGDPTLERKLWVALFVADSKEIDRQLGNTIEAFTLNSPKARFEEAPDGTPYAILPSTTVVKLRSGDRVKIFSPFLALLDDDAWYLINVGFGGLMGSVKGLYPSFDEIEFGYATQEKL